MRWSPEVRRVVSNYLRLITTFALGIFIVRLMLSAGQEYFGFYSLITIGFGLGIMLKELARIALVPRLSEGLSAGDDVFKQRLSSAVCISTTLGLIGALVMGVLYLNIHRFNLPENILDGAKVFVAFRALQVFVTVSLAPFPILLLVMRRYVMANLFTAMERFIEFCAVFFAIKFVANFTEGLLPSIAATSFTLNAALLLVVVGWFYALDPKFKVSISLANRVEIVKLLSFFGLTAVLVLSANLFLRFDIAFVNLKSGILATVIFGITVQAIGMLNQLTNGLVGGLDAAFAFSKTQKNSENKILSLVWVSSFLQSTLAISAYGIVFFVGQELLVLWLGSGRLDQQAISATHGLIVIMGLGMIVRGLAEVWINALNGLGNIRLYVWWLLPGAFLNPILLILIYSSSPKFEAYSIAAYLFTGLQVLTYGLAVPSVLARNLGVPLHRLYAPLVAPVASVCLAVVVLVLWGDWIGSGSDAMAVVFTIVLFALTSILSLLYLRSRLNRKRA